MTLQQMKSYSMLLSMLLGGVFFRYIAPLSFLTPYLIAMMLLFSYSGVSWREMRMSRLHVSLLAIQIIGSLLVYFFLNRFNPILAQGAFICIVAPTATSAVVITGMLGGNINSLTFYSIFCNLAVVLIAPVVFPFIDYRGEGISFAESFWAISKSVLLLLLFPLLLTLFLNRYFPGIHSGLRKMRGISFYLWVVALFIVTAKTVHFVCDQDSSSYKIELLLGLVALFICIIQFYIGKKLGKRYNDTIAGGQALGQKNTILAIWMAQTYLNPISSLAPGAYVLWQNIINSYQVWRKMNRDV